MAQLSQIFDGVAKDINACIDDIARETYIRIYNRTPVDTGYAQSRWDLTTGTETFTISNDAEYISFLEEGSSQQAPMGMVAVTMNEMDQIVAEAARKYKK